LCIILKRPERPFVETKTRKEMEKRERGILERAEGELVDPENVPEAVADRLGFRCVNLRRI